MFGALKKLPTGARSVVMVIGALAPVAMLAIPILGHPAGTIFTGTYIVLGSIAGFAVLFQNKKNKEKAEGMAAGVKENAGHNPDERDPNKLANLDKLKSEFEKGIQVYEKRGKSLYSLPWYVIVGEPGSGKTEAIRHSDIPFPPQVTKNQKHMGVGGTISMNWWFTNNAVILDTAGRLFLDERRSDGKSGWTSFLQMLRKNRPECPINGILLVIPSTSLVPEAKPEAEREALEKLRRMAGKIARQFEHIQDELRVRYPVYVVVTKTDKVTGFRELFESLDDTQRYHIFGWSNPDSLDSEFNPSWIRKPLQEIAAKLSKRRLTLMRDPTPQATGGKRIDEVSGLYSMPSSFLELGAKLETYLHDIFADNAWTGTPPFLRGIYFTSAMQEGAVLDKNLAEALGKLIQDLDKEKKKTNPYDINQAFFLRDLFLKKIFKERGLITPVGKVKNVKGRLKRWIMGGLVGTALLILGLSFLSDTSPKEEIALWQDLKKSPFKNPENAAVGELVRLKKQKGSPAGQVQYEYLGNKIIPDGDSGRTLVATLSALAEKTDGAVEVSVLFRPVQWVSSWSEDSLESSRRQRFRTIIKNYTVKSLVSAARQKLKTDPPPATRSSSERRQKAAVLMLAKLEKAHDTQRALLADGEDPKEGLLPPEAFVTTLADFVLNETGSIDEAGAIAKLIKAAYGGNWPYDEEFPLASTKDLAQIVERLAGASGASSLDGSQIQKINEHLKALDEHYKALETEAEKAAAFSGESFRRVQAAMDGYLGTAKKLDSIEALRSLEVRSGPAENKEENDEAKKSLTEEIKSSLGKVAKKDSHLKKVFASLSTPDGGGDGEILDLTPLVALGPAGDAKKMPYLSRTTFRREDDFVYRHIANLITDCGKSFENYKGKSPKAVKIVLRDSRRKEQEDLQDYFTNELIGPVSKLLFKAAKVELTEYVIEKLLYFPLVTGNDLHMPVNEDERTACIELLSMVADGSYDLESLPKLIKTRDLLFEKTNLGKWTPRAIIWAGVTTPRGFDAREYPFKNLDFKINSTQLRYNDFALRVRDLQPKQFVEMEADSSLTVSWGKPNNWDDIVKTEGTWGLMNFCLVRKKSWIQTEQRGIWTITIQSTPASGSKDVLTIVIRVPNQSLLPPDDWPNLQKIQKEFQQWKAGTTAE